MKNPIIVPELRESIAKKNEYDLYDSCTVVEAIRSRTIPPMVLPRKDS